MSTTAGVPLENAICLPLVETSRKDATTAPATTLRRRKVIWKVKDGAPVRRGEIVATVTVVEEEEEEEEEKGGNGKTKPTTTTTTSGVVQPSAAPTAPPPRAGPHLVRARKRSRLTTAEAIKASAAATKSKVAAKTTMPAPTRRTSSVLSQLVKSTNQTNRLLEGRPQSRTEEEEDGNMKRKGPVTQQPQQQPQHLRAPCNGLLRRHQSSDKKDEEYHDETTTRVEIGHVELCLHPTVFGGLCAVCGMAAATAAAHDQKGTLDDNANNDDKDDKKKKKKKSEETGGFRMTPLVWQSDRNTVVQSTDEEESTSLTVSGGATLVVSTSEAKEIADSTSRRLRQAKKLSLVLDLDHTLIHATADRRALHFVHQEEEEEEEKDKEEAKPKKKKEEEEEEKKDKEKDDQQEEKQGKDVDIVVVDENDKDKKKKKKKDTNRDSNSDEEKKEQESMAMDSAPSKNNEGSKQKHKMIADLRERLGYPVQPRRRRSDLRTLLLPATEGAPDTKNNNNNGSNQPPQRLRHFVKIRPHLYEFLTTLEDSFEIVIYTAGTRAYAQEVTMILCRFLIYEQERSRSDSFPIVYDEEELILLRDEVQHVQGRLEHLQKVERLRMKKKKKKKKKKRRKKPLLKRTLTPPPEGGLSSLLNLKDDDDEDNHNDDDDVDDEDDGGGGGNEDNGANSKSATMSAAGETETTTKPEEDTVDMSMEDGSETKTNMEEAKEQPKMDRDATTGKNNDKSEDANDVVVVLDDDKTEGDAMDTDMDSGASKEDPIRLDESPEKSASPPNDGESVENPICLVNSPSNPGNEASLDDATRQMPRKLEFLVGDADSETVGSSETGLGSSASEKETDKPATKEEEVADETKEARAKTEGSVPKRKSEENGIADDKEATCDDSDLAPVPKKKRPDDGSSDPQEETGEEEAMLAEAEAPVAGRIPKRRRPKEPESDGVDGTSENGEADVSSSSSSSSSSSLIAKMQKRVRSNEDGTSKEVAKSDHDEPEPKEKRRVTFGELPPSHRESRNADADDGAPQEDTASVEDLKLLLEELQTELQKAEKQEEAANRLRQKLFGSRIVSRTDVTDLGRDVKSLRRIFPCGGTMAAIVDDREDVWANAGDNATGRPGEPPENLILCRPYHWRPFLRFADVNNAAGADLSSSKTPGDGGGGGGGGGGGVMTQEDEVEKDEVCLLWIRNVLVRLYNDYYASSNKGKCDVPQLLRRMRRQVLGPSTHLVLSGLIPLSQQDRDDDDDEPRPPVIRYAEELGAKVVSDVTPAVSIVVAGRDGSDKTKRGRETPGCVVVKPSWLMESYWSLTKRDFQPHFFGPTVPPPRRVSPIPFASPPPPPPPPLLLGDEYDEESDHDEEFEADFEKEMMDEQDL